MTKRNKIIYWIAILWLSLGMLPGAIVELSQVKAEVYFITDLGYPVYFITLLAIWKIAKVVVLLLPKFSLSKEWAYAVFFFVMSGAVYSHIAAGDTVNDNFLPCCY